MNRLYPVYPAIQLSDGTPACADPSYVMPPRGPHGTECIVLSRTGHQHRFRPSSTPGQSELIDFGDLGKYIPGQGLIVQFSGPVGVGKGTLSRMILKSILGSELLITCTTRAPRDNEEHGVHYYFLTDDQFADHEAAGEFIETNVFSTGRKYGTREDDVHRQMDRGPLIVSDINVDGAKQMRDRAGRLPGVVLDIFVMPPGRDIDERLDACRQRATADVNTRDNIEARLEEARREIVRAGEFSHVVVNDEIGRAFDEVMAIVTVARTRQMILMDNPCAV